MGGWKFFRVWYFVTFFSPRSKDKRSQGSATAFEVGTMQFGLVEMATDNLHWDLAARRAAFIDSLDSFCLRQDAGPDWVC